MRATGELPGYSSRWLDISSTEGDTRDRGKQIPSCLVRVCAILAGSTSVPPAHVERLASIQCPSSRAQNL